VAILALDRQEVLLGGAGLCGFENEAIACDYNGPNGNCPATQTKNKCVRYGMSVDRCVFFRTSINSACKKQAGDATKDCTTNPVNNTCGSLIYGTRNPATGNCGDCDQPEVQCGAQLVEVEVNQCTPPPPPPPPSP